MADKENGILLKYECERNRFLFNVVFVVDYNFKFWIYIFLKSKA